MEREGPEVAILVDEGGADALFGRARDRRSA